jgi:hypothetical protein
MSGYAQSSAAYITLVTSRLAACSGSSLAATDRVGRWDFESSGIDGENRGTQRAIRNRLGECVQATRDIVAASCAIVAADRRRGWRRG